jgi:hypothetical protein
MPRSSGNIVGSRRCFSRLETEGPAVRVVVSTEDHGLSQTGKRVPKTPWPRMMGLSPVSKELKTK